MAKGSFCPQTRTLPKKVIEFLKKYIVIITGETTGGLIAVDLKSLPLVISDRQRRRARRERTLVCTFSIKAILVYTVGAKAAQYSRAETP